MKRREFTGKLVKILPLIFTPSIFACKEIQEVFLYYDELVECESAELAERSEQRYIIYNNDGNDFSVPDIDNGTSISKSQFLASRFEQIRNTSITHIFYCTGIFGSYTHNSKIANQLKPNLSSSLQSSYTEDTLELAIKYGNDNNKKVFWSVRMNDIHDAYTPDLLTDWKKENPEYLMGASSANQYANHWSACNYEHPVVQERIFAFINEVIEDYDIDGIELDFMRHPVFFREQLFGRNVSDYQRDIMTNLVRDVKSVLQNKEISSGRKLELAIRIPDSFGYAKAIGLDVNKWLCNSLVDIVVYGGYFQLESIKRTLELSQKFQAKFVPCISQSRFQRDRNIPGYYYPYLVAEIIAMQKAGIADFYFFNFFEQRLISMIQNLSTLTTEVNYQKVLGGEIDFWLRDGSYYIKS